MICIFVSLPLYENAFENELGWRFWLVGERSCKKGAKGSCGKRLLPKMTFNNKLESETEN